MTTIAASTTISEQPKDPFSDKSEKGTPISEQKERQVDVDAWNTIDGKLIEWGRDPSQLEDEDIIPPSSDAIASASKFACEFRDQGKPAPLRVVPNGDGGIVFRWEYGETSISVEIEADESKELRCFHNCRLKFQGPLE